MWDIIVPFGAGAIFGSVGAYLSRDRSVSSDKNKVGYVKNLLKLYKNSSETINILTDLDPEIFCNGDVVIALRDATDRGVKIKLGYDTAIEIPKPYQELSDKEKLEIKHVKNLPKYFSVVDSRHVRVEEHKPFEKRIALTYWDYPRFSEKMNEDFNKLFAQI